MRTTAITGERGVKFARVIQWPTHVVNGAIYSLPFDLLKDFAMEGLARKFLVVGARLLCMRQH